MLTVSHLYSWLHDHCSIVVGVSGGPDSMYLLYVLKNFWVAQGRDLSLIHVAHYNHAIRNESYDEAQRLAQYCVDVTFHSDVYQGIGHSERDLRHARHAFFQSVMEGVGSNVLLLGHNLTDRIETSLMNMKRGCQMKGFLNMRQQEIIRNYTYQDMRSKESETEYVILRPLLCYSKQDIQQYCDEQGIPYVIDQSNFDTSVSVRNKLRSEIVSKLSTQELQNWCDLYARLELSQSIYDNPVRDETIGAWYVGQRGDRNLEYLSRLFEWSGCYADMTQGRLLEWQKRIAHSFSGQKFVGGWRWWIKQKKVWIAMV